MRIANVRQLGSFRIPKDCFIDFIYQKLLLESNIVDFWYSIFTNLLEVKQEKFSYQYKKKYSKYY
ncbi:unnamed protein product [Paramecium octaurelia]|uniref:Uncharacterized protein n=1 Tax=Paramecium octaurelia TaxID=43137 RepID=A0A8S1Y2E1_PAROT|nr:unnamed protein product [Paramecium octaurelia]